MEPCLMTISSQTFFIYGACLLKMCHYIGQAEADIELQLPTVQNCTRMFLKMACAHLFALEFFDFVTKYVRIRT